MRQLVYEKENSEFKPVKLRLKIHLVSYPARVEGLVNMYIYMHTHTYMYVVHIYVFACAFWFIWFYGISTFMVYLMPNYSLYLVLSNPKWGEVGTYNFPKVLKVNLITRRAIEFAMTSQCSSLVITPHRFPPYIYVRVCVCVCFGSRFSLQNSIPHACQTSSIKYAQYIYIYIYIYMYVSVCVCVSVCARVRVCVCMCVCERACVYLYENECSCMC